jgi:predicted HD phosphohydrolase
MSFEQDTISVNQIPTETERENCRCRIEAIHSLFIHFGFESTLGDPVPFGTYMLQAAHIAKINEENDEVVIAGLMHNIG